MIKNEAIQKESSEKLEKAEILHLTVEYLRDLNTSEDFYLNFFLIIKLN